MVSVTDQTHENEIDEISTITNEIDEISTIKNEDTSHFFEYKMIGRSVNKRRMNVVFIGERVNPQLKLFIMAGQHGDERYSRKATERLISYL